LDISKPHGRNRAIAIRIREERGKPEVTPLEACHRLALIEGQKENIGEGKFGTREILENWLKRVGRELHE